VRLPKAKRGPGSPPCPWCAWEPPTVRAAAREGHLRLDGDVVYTAVDQKPKSGRPLKRRRNVGENPVVTMLAGHYSEDWETLWWVRADGRAAILTGQRQMAKPLRLLADRYWPYREAPPTDPVLAVTAGRWTGRSGARAGRSGAGAG